MYNFYKSYQFLLTILAFIYASLGYAHSPVIHIEEGTQLSNFTSLYASEANLNLNTPNKTKLYIIEGSIFNFENNLHAQIVYLQSKYPSVQETSDKSKEQQNKKFKLYPNNRKPKFY